jgi:hypothetical protein
MRGDKRHPALKGLVGVRWPEHVRNGVQLNPEIEEVIGHLLVERRESLPSHGDDRFVVEILGQKRRLE